jgi:hypothetical protein
MGFELDAFLGKTSELRTWKGRLPSAVACDLGGDLGLVPVTGRLYLELRARLGEEEANRLDVTRPRTYPSPSYEEGVRRWGAEASAGTVVAFVSVGEFGNQSHEEATLWSGGREMLSGVGVKAVLAHFRDQARLDLGNRPIDVELERYRGEDAAEKWAAASSPTLKPKPGGGDGAT